MKAVVSLHRPYGNDPLAQSEVEVNDVGELTVNELFQRIGINGSEVYASDTLQITFIDFKDIE